MQIRALSVVWLMLGALSYACSDEEPAGAVHDDAGGTLDGGAVDGAPPDVGPKDGAPADAPPETACSAPTGPGTVHASGTLESDDEVWTAAGSPHVISFALAVRTGKKLTIEPCAVVRLDENMSLEVREGAELVAEGTETRPITFERSTGEEAWGALIAQDDAKVSLAYVTLDGGGNPNNGDPRRVSSLYLSADPNDDVPVRQNVRVDHVTVRNSSSLGVFLSGTIGFSNDSHDLVVTGSATAPLRTWQRAVGTIPSGAYTGNTDDQFLLERGGYGNDAIDGDVTVRQRGLPYHVLSDLRVGRAGGDTDVTGTLTIEPGVTLRFDPNTVLGMSGTDGTGDGDLALGSLHAVGTAAQPIVFTSAAPTPAAGDWGGIVFSGVATARTRIEHATIAYAGGGNGIASASCGTGEGSASDEAAVTISGWDARPSSSFLVNTRIEHSPRFGVVSGWRGDPVDFVSTNEFIDVASCWVSSPRNVDNVCPANPVCPGVD